MVFEARLCRTCHRKNCWSCVAAGLSTRDKARKDMSSLCAPCYGERKCDACGATCRQQQDRTIPACGQCNKRLSEWCGACYSHETLSLHRCAGCIIATPAKQKGICWSCNTTKRRGNTTKYRGCCQQCYQDRTCPSCGRWHAADATGCLSKAGGVAFSVN